MYLPLRYAALVPFAVAMAVMCVPGLFKVLAQSNGTQIVSTIMFALFLAVFAGVVVGFALVPPNVAAALVANWFGASTLVQFCIVLAGVSIILQVLMLFTLADFNRAMSIDIRPDAVWPYVAIAANAGVLCVTAVIYGLRHD